MLHVRSLPPSVRAMRRETALWTTTERRFGGSSGLSMGTSNHWKHRKQYPITNRLGLAVMGVKHLRHWSDMSGHD